MAGNLGNILGSALFTALLCLPAFAKSEAEDQIRAKYYLEPNSILKFEGEKGAPISPDEFSRQAKAGKRFVLMKSKDSPDGPVTAIFVMQAPPAANSSTKAAEQPAAPISKMIGKPLPAFKLMDAEGKVVTNGDLLGRPTLINFFFAECLPCILETPMLNAYQAKRKDLRMLAITFDGKPAIDKYIRKHKFAWQSLVDAQSFIAQVDLQGYPSFMLVDAKGIVKAVQTHPDFALVEVNGAVKAVALLPSSLKESKGKATSELHDQKRLDDWVVLGLKAQ